LKIALAQINYHIGNFEDNEKKVLNAIHKAFKLKADIVVFAELAITGYPPRDFLEFNDFIDKCEQSIKRIANECKGIAAIIGAPSRNPEVKGKNLFNTAYFLAEGKIKSLHHKSLLPNYDVFDEYRYFEPNNDYELAEYKGKKLAITICEDLWNIGDDLLYRGNPMDELSKLNPDIIINIAASPFHYEQAELRKKKLHENVAKYHLPLFYVNHVGAQTELLFDGGSLVINSSGVLVDELKYFSEDFRVYDVNEINITQKKKAVNTSSKIELIHDGLVMGIRNYFEKLGFKQAILGLSGGIDSAITLVLATEALGSENVRSVLMPSPYSSDHSMGDALWLVNRLDSPYSVIPINHSIEIMNLTLDPIFKNLPEDVTEENIQARIRGIILMAMSNKFGSILLNTSNKSEAAVGYGTLYGDMNGGLSVLGDVYKTQVYELARYINRDREIIPENTITKPPSAELRPDQKDSDTLPDYSVLDKILYQYIELRKGPNDLINMGFDQALVYKVLKMVNTSEYKRFQTPPILRVSPKAFGMGRRMPIVGKYLS
jgi:NAD+ synthase (glutamine-hydrolysing)